MVNGRSQQNGQSGKNFSLIMIGKIVIQSSEKVVDEVSKQKVWLHRSRMDPIINKTDSNGITPYSTVLEILLCRESSHILSRKSICHGVSLNYLYTSACIIRNKQEQ